MGSDRFTEILRERYYAGAYGSAFLMMSKITLESLAAASPPSVAAALGYLWGIPIELDTTLPDGKWRLIDRTTGVQIEVGWFAGIDYDDHRTCEGVCACPCTLVGAA